MNKLIYILLLLPILSFGQNTKPIFTVIYPDKVSLDSSMQDLKAEYLEYEKKRELDRLQGKKPSKRYLDEIDNLTISKIIGNVTVQSLQFYLYNSYPKAKYKLYNNTNGLTSNEIIKSLKSDYVIIYDNLIISRNDSIGLNLKFNFRLFDIANNGFMIDKEFIADTKNYGEMWGCSESEFKCLINNTLRIGVKATAEMILNINK